MGRREISAAVSTYFSPVLVLTASDMLFGDSKAGFKYLFGYPKHSDQHRGVPHRVMVLAKVLAILVCSALRGFRHCSL